jgi:hypothetical protein
VPFVGRLADSEQALDILRRDIRLVGRQRQSGQIAQYLGVIEQLSAAALGFGQRFIEQIAGLQRLQGLQEQRALLVEILRAGLRLEQRA